MRRRIGRYYDWMWFAIREEFKQKLQGAVPVKVLVCCCVYKLASPAVQRACSDSLRLAFALRVPNPMPLYLIAIASIHVNR